MTYAEYESRLSDVVKKPDEAPVLVKALLQEIKADTDTLDTLRTDIEAKDEKIRSLQDTNMKLFLSQTSEDTDQKESWEDMEPGEDKMNAYLATLKKGE